MFAKFEIYELIWCLKSFLYARLKSESIFYILYRITLTKIQPALNIVVVSRSNQSHKSKPYLLFESKVENLSDFLTWLEIFPNNNK
ncbi:hypothetical protein BpHYR1_037479 [Brachionus plicatilis]|uniref:Uncharacterized protein n=1 Tax=Brachionus plicatilis TaxID=10195 RepID=A0A3M7Q630_BRAPC|nr:hypothetical protein BpHYR1_037479 [Brachionus plicatilis]